MNVYVFYFINLLSQLFWVQPFFNILKVTPLVRYSCWRTGFNLPSLKILTAIITTAQMLNWLTILFTEKSFSVLHTLQLRLSGKEFELHLRNSVDRVATPSFLAPTEPWGCPRRAGRLGVSSFWKDSLIPSKDLSLQKDVYSWK